MMTDAELLDTLTTITLVRELKINPDAADAREQVAAVRAKVGEPEWRRLRDQARARVEQKRAADAAAAEVERKRAAWVAFEQRAASVVEASAMADSAIAALAAALHGVRDAIAAARASFPGDPGVSSLFDIAALNRRAEQAALLSVNGAVFESLAETARNAIALIEKIRAAQTA